MIAASLKKVKVGTRPSPSVVKVMMWIATGKIMASAEQLIEPTNEIKLSSWGMPIARIPEIKTKRFWWDRTGRCICSQLNVRLQTQNGTMLIIFVWRTYYKVFLRAREYYREVLLIMSYTRGSGRKGYLFQASGIWKGRDFTFEVYERVEKSQCHCSL